MTGVNFPLVLDQGAERKLALVKVYSLLIKIAEKEESAKINENEEKPSAPLQENIPPSAL